MTTTREVFDRHVSHQLDRDLDAILTDYAPDAVVVGPDGIGSGHDHIRASYEQVLPLIGSLDVTEHPSDTSPAQPARHSPALRRHPHAYRSAARSKGHGRVPSTRQERSHVPFEGRALRPALGCFHWRIRAHRLTTG